MMKLVVNATQINTSKTIRFAQIVMFNVQNVKGLLKQIAYNAKIQITA